MQSMEALLNPKAIAVIGASQQPGRGTSVVANLRDAGFKGEVFAVNPRYTDVLGFPCYLSVSELPDTVDCIVIAIPARAACDVLEQAFTRGIRAAIVLAAGFDDDGTDGPLGTRLRTLAKQEMAICGPNCFGLVNVKTGAVAFNGVVPKTLHRGPVALVSQSGSLGNFVFGPLMRDRKLGFSYFVSCGNQAGATIEDYALWRWGRPSADLSPGPALYDANVPEKDWGCAASYGRVGADRAREVCGRMWLGYQELGGCAAFGAPTGVPTRSPESGVISQPFENGWLELSPKDANPYRKDSSAAP